MLVTFATKDYPSITMFGDVATKLIRMMGLSGKVPSAIRAEDVPAALERLREQLGAHEEPPPPPEADEDSSKQRVSLALRAYPLLELLETAEAHEDGVSWH